MQTNIIFDTIHLILCVQQTGEIDNLNVSWAKYFACVVCRFHVAAGTDTAPPKTPSGAIAKVN
jgi:hypothetical protein